MLLKYIVTSYKEAIKAIKIILEKMIQTVKTIKLLSK